MTENPTISLVIPVLNEIESIEPLFKAIKKSLSECHYELILVDDGSTDGTVEKAKSFLDPNIRVIELTKRFGQSTAMAAGIDHAQGRFIVTMDGDLQNDPQDIPIMLKKLEDENWDVVMGKRQKREDNTVRKIPSKIANSLIRKMTGVYISDYGCTLKVFRARFARNLGLYGEMHRFIPVLAFLQGARITQMKVRHHARKFGKSKYSLNRTFKVMSDLILIVFIQKYLSRPMHLFGIIGLLTFFIGAMLNIYMLILKLMGEDIWGKPLLLLGIFLVLGGIQLITTGIIAELLIKTYYESQDKKRYMVRNIISSNQSIEVE